MLAEKPDQARSDLEEAVLLAGGNIGILLPAGVLLADAGFIEAAGAAFDEAAKAEPHNAAIYETHAAVVLEADDAKAGAALADRALSAPLGEQRFDVLEPAAELYAAASRRTHVRKCLDELRILAVGKALRGLQAETADRLAVSTELIDLLAQAKEYDEAIAEANHLLDRGELEKNQVVSLSVRLAELHAEAGRVAEAKKLLEATIARAEGRERSSIRLELAKLLVRHDQVDAAREVLLQAVAEDERDLPCRLLLLSLDPAQGKGPDRQALADQIKGIEGQAGINWRYAQAVAYLNPPKAPEDWTTYPHRKTAETLLLECLAKDPSWGAAAVALVHLIRNHPAVRRAVLGLVMSCPNIKWEM